MGGNPTRDEEDDDEFRFRNTPPPHLPAARQDAGINNNLLETLDSTALITHNYMKSGIYLEFSYTVSHWSYINYENRTK